MPKDADYRIKQRAVFEDGLAKSVRSNVEQSHLTAKAQWENDTHKTIIKNQQLRLFNTLKGNRDADLDRRRQALSMLLRDEKEMFKQEMKDREETSGQVAARLQEKALALKAKREAEREAFCNQKLYQQWRQGMDDLRVADSKLYELQVMAARDEQVQWKKEREDEEQMNDDIFYAELAKDYDQRLQREKREIATRKKRNEVVAETIEAQILLRKEKEGVEKEWQEKERESLKILWAQHQLDEKTKKQREIIAAKQARKKVDEYLAIDNKIKKDQITKDKQDDKAMVLYHLKREKEEADAEDAAKAAAKLAMLAHKEQMRLEGIKEKESEEMLLSIQHAESEKQWRKRYASWGKEAMQRRLLMEECYLDRAQQIEDKKELIQKNKHLRMADRDNMLLEQDRQETMELEKEELQLAASKKHQEALFKQMDEHQVQRHRENQQKLFDQQQARLAELRLSNALDTEKQKQMVYFDEIAKHRATMASERDDRIASEKQERQQAAQKRLEARPF